MSFKKYCGHCGESIVKKASSKMIIVTCERFDHQDEMDGYPNSSRVERKGFEWEEEAVTFLKGRGPLKANIRTINLHNVLTREVVLRPVSDEFDDSTGEFIVYKYTFKGWEPESIVEILGWLEDAGDLVGSRVDYKKASRKKAFRKRASGRSILVGYSISTYDSMDHGSYEETGIDDEIPCSDVEDALTYLRRKGPFSPSSSHIDLQSVKHTWLATETSSDPDSYEDAKTGKRTSYSYTLKGFTPLEMMEIYKTLDDEGDLLGGRIVM